MDYHFSQFFKAKRKQNKKKNNLLKHHLNWKHQWWITMKTTHPNILWKS